MGKAVLGPAIFVIVNPLLKQDRIALIITQEKRITFGGDC
jgi:hypothetical protein